MASPTTFGFETYGNISGDKCHRVAIYVPTLTLEADAVRKPDVTASKLLAATQALMVAHFAGCSEIRITGFYKNDDGTATAEPVHVCYAYATTAELTKAKEEIIRMANAIAIEYRQSSVAVEVDGKMYFYSPTEYYKKKYEAYLATLPRKSETALHSYRRFVANTLRIDNKSQRVDGPEPLPSSATAPRPKPTRDLASFFRPTGSSPAAAPRPPTSTIPPPPPPGPMQPFPRPGPLPPPLSKGAPLAHTGKPRIR